MKPSPSFSPFVRSCLVIAIVAGSVSTVNVMKVRGKMLALQSSLNAEVAARERVERELVRTTQVLEQSSAVLEETKAALDKCNGERDRTLAEAAAGRSQVEQLDKALKDARLEREEVKAELARYTNTGLKAEQVARLAATMKELRETLAAVTVENGVLAENLRKLKAQNDTDSPVKLPANLTGKVNVSDPKWGFVILDAGSEKGMLDRAELLVSRNGKLVGKVKIRRVERERSFADLLPEWRFGELIEGDVAVPANPEG
jgi:chromosome segregation ATPase